MKNKHFLVFLLLVFMAVTISSCGISRKERARIDNLRELKELKELNEENEELLRESEKKVEQKKNNSLRKILNVKLMTDSLSLEEDINEQEDAIEVKKDSERKSYKPSSTLNSSNSKNTSKNQPPSSSNSKFKKLKRK